MAVRAIAPEAGAEGFQRHGPEYPVNGDRGALFLRALSLGDETGGGRDEVWRVAVGTLDAPGEVLERDARDHPVLLETRSRFGCLGSALGGTLFAQVDVLGQDRGDDGEGDGDEREHETVMDGVRETHTGDLQDLVDKLLTTGEGRSRAVQGVAGLVANQRVGVLEGLYETARCLRRGVVLQMLGVTGGDERTDHRGAERRAEGPDELRGRGRDAEEPLLDGTLDGERRRRHERAEAEASDHEVEGDGPLGRVNIQRRQQVDAEGHHYRAGDHERFDALHAGYDLAADDPHGRHAEDERGEHGARARRGLPEHALHKERGVQDDPEHPDTDHEHEKRGGAEDPALEERERNNRLLRPEFHGYEGGEQEACYDEPDHDAGGVLVVTHGDPREREQERDDRSRYGGGAEVVDLHPDPPNALMKHHGQREQREDAEGQVDVEDPTPAYVVRDPTAHHRPDDAGEREDAEEDALVLRTTCRIGEDVGDAGEYVGEDHAGPEPLQTPEQDQLGHPPRSPAERAGGKKDGHPRDDEPLPAVDVPELADDRDHGGGSEQVRGRDPSVVLEPVEVGDYLG